MSEPDHPADLQSVAPCSSAAASRRVLRGALRGRAASRAKVGLPAAVRVGLFFAVIVGFLYATHGLITHGLRQIETAGFEPRTLPYDHSSFDPALNSELYLGVRR